MQNLKSLIKQYCPAILPLIRLAKQYLRDLKIGSGSVEDRFVSMRHGYPLNRNEGYKCFLIIGSGRSGTTLLRRILCANEELYIPPETYVLREAIDIFRQAGNMKWKSLVYLILSHFEYHDEFDKFGISLRPLVQRLINTPEDKRSLAYILDSFYRFWGEENAIKGERWGDKTPINTAALEGIYSTFPEAQFIHMIRDGVDVVSSFMESGIENLSKLEVAAEMWARFVCLGREFGRKYPESYLEIYYEDLVKNPHRVVREICNFLNIKYTPHMIHSEKIADKMADVKAHKHHYNVRNPISDNSIGKGRKKLRAEEKSKLQKIIGKDLELLGYEPISSAV